MRITRWSDAVRPPFWASGFGGWGYEQALLDDIAYLDKAYAGGGPMGGDLPARPADAGFLSAARRRRTVRQIMPEARPRMRGSPGREGIVSCH